MEEGARRTGPGARSGEGKSIIEALVDKVEGGGERLAFGADLRRPR